MSRGKILFVITEDWFFRSHFMPLARRALAEGYDVRVAARDTGALQGEPGVKLLDMPFPRGSLRPWEVGAQIARIRALVVEEKPDIVHAIALKPIALALLSRLEDVGLVFAITGRGYLALGRAPWTRFVDWRLRRMLRRGLRAPRTRLLVENRADQHWVDANDPKLHAKTTLMPGAGVDPDAFTPAPEPQSSAIIVGIVARLIWSKGIDLAVAAIQRLRAEGLAIHLRIAGAADEQNPEHVSAEALADWRALEGIELLGKVSDINAFWAGAHIACLPSRGGEGLPRSLIEAAACARPVVTTNTPGCADFVGGEEIGVVVEPGRVEALAAALKKLALDADLRTRMGAAAREKVLAGYTEAHAAAAALEAWRRVSPLCAADE